MRMWQKNLPERSPVQETRTGTATQEIHLIIIYKTIDFKEGIGFEM